jgi:SET and MYND domain-containing protein
MTAFQETHTAEFGRHLVSSKELKPEEVVLEQQPYAAVLYDDQVQLRCDWCFQAAQQGSTLLRCARSKFAHYCSREHQKAAWRAYYKKECAALVACAPHVPPATVRLAARVLWRRDR